MYHVKKRVFIGLFLLLIVVAMIIPVFTGSFLNVDLPQPSQSDALYILAGDYQKKNPLAARFYREGYTPLIILYNDALFSCWSPEQNRNLYQVEWAEEDLVKRGVPRSAIVRLPYAGNGTRYEAIALRRYLRAHPLSRILLVTHQYHTKRALMTFRRILGDSPKINPVTTPFELTPSQARYTYLTEAAKMFYYAGWLYGRYPFLKPEIIDGVTPDSRTLLPLSLFRRSAPLEVKTTELNPAWLGTRYAAAVASQGGVGPYFWDLVDGALPPGLTMNDRGGINGTPGNVGIFSFTVRVTDGADCSVRRRFTLTVEKAALVVATAVLPVGRVGESYTASLSASGGMKPYVWYPVRPPPTGLLLADDGRITGTLQVPGSYQIAVRVRDAAGVTATATLALKVIMAPLTIGATAPRSLTAGDPVMHRFAASGGNPPYTWSVATGMLPPGISLRYDGSLTGVPTAPGSYQVDIRVADRSGQTAVRPFALPVGIKSLVIKTSTLLPTASARKQYSFVLPAAGGVKPYSWELVEGDLPSGMKLSKAGILSGPPWAPRTYRFTVQVTDASSATVRKNLELIVE